MVFSNNGLFLIILLSFCAYSANAQNATNTKSSDSKNIYYQALIKHIENSDNNEQTVIVEKNLFTDPLPKTMGSRTIEYLDGYQIRRHLKSKEEIIVIKVIPLQVDNGLFFVTIIPFKVTKEKKQLHYANSGGDEVVFTFDSNSNEFIFKEFKRGNI
jgi:hypothetical protein